MNDRGAPDLIFASPDKIAALTRGRKGGGNQWMGLCPCHGDTNPSLSIRWGRNGQTLVKCHAACTQDQLLAYFRGRGYRLDSGPPPRPVRPKRGVLLTASIAIVALTKSERLMLDMILVGDNPAYNEFEIAGVRRKSIPAGLRALEALGFIEVDRRPFNVREGRYNRNRYSPKGNWTDFEPDGTSMKARRAALAEARAMAGSARKGEAAASDTPKENSPISDLRGGVSRGAFRGGVLPSTSYGREGESLAYDGTAPETPRSRLTDGSELPTEAAAADSAGPEGEAGLSERAGATLAEMVRRGGFRIEAATFPELERFGYILTDARGGTRVTARGELRGRALLRPPRHICGYECRKGCVYVRSADIGEAP